MGVKIDDVVTVRIKVYYVGKGDGLIEGWMLDGDDNLFDPIDFYPECVAKNLGPLPKPQPSEPMTVGAVVMVDGVRWVRWSETRPFPWINESGAFNQWAAIKNADDVQILASGLTPS